MTENFEKSSDVPRLILTPITISVGLVSIFINLFLIYFGFSTWLLCIYASAAIFGYTKYSTQSSQMTEFRSFPRKFQWGVSTSAYQIEGAHDQDGRGPCVWDTFCHNDELKGRVKECANGDVACDSYHNLDSDINLLKDLKVTLYHFDLPQALEDEGGWLNPESVVWFVQYAECCFKLLGDHVQFWITINEPSYVALKAYQTGEHAPGIRDESGRNYYITAKHMLLAHANVWRVYNAKYRHFNGQLCKCAIALDAASYYPLFLSLQSHRDAASLVEDFALGIFAHPIFSADGGWPPSVLTAMKAKGSESRLPELTKDEIELIKGTSDYFGLNFYVSRVVYPNSTSDFGFTGDANVAFVDENSVIRKIAELTGIFFSKPDALRHLLNRCALKYGWNWPVYILETGVKSDETLQDEQRIKFLHNIVKNIHDSINIDRVNVKGLNVWSLLDNFEWEHGYSTRFGLVRVDFANPARPRTPKASYHDYRRIVQRNGLDVPLPIF